MIAHRIAAICALSLMFMGLNGCQTTDSSEGMTLPPSAQIAFVPRVRRVAVQAAEGRYPNLFTSASYAVWGNEPMETTPSSAPMADAGSGGDTVSTEAKMDVQMDSVPVPPDVVAARASGLTIQCHLESEFPDRSIAYDAVGLRGMTITLKLPDGRELQPAQKTLGADLEESPVGALRRYGRKLTLYFSDGQFMVENPAINPKAPGVRLVINGVESQFYFEWPATPDFLATPAPRLDQQAAEFTRKNFKKARAAVSRTSHNLD